MVAFLYEKNPALSNDDDDPPSPSSQPPCSNVNSKRGIGGRKATAIMDYKAKDASEISLRKGEELLVPGECLAGKWVLCQFGNADGFAPVGRLRIWG